MKTLQELFVEARSSRLEIGGNQVIQQDTFKIPRLVMITVTFVGDRIYQNNAAVVAVPKPGRIQLSDGTFATAIAIWDEPNLPRTVSHRVQSPAEVLQVYNKYRIIHSPDFITEDSFTGNAGMIVTTLGKRKRLYECSGSLGEFNKKDLVFELEWAPLAE